MNSIIKAVIIVLVLIIGWIIGLLSGATNKTKLAEISGSGEDPELLKWLPNYENEEECQIKVPFSRVIDGNTRLMPYKRRRAEYKFTTHVGQRKLLLAEMEFLTWITGELSNGGKVPLDKVTWPSIVYAGAADGAHQILMAQEFFPQFEYYLYDPAQFDKRLYGIKNIHIVNDYFTDETSKKWFETSNVIFISDIRRTPDEDYTKSAKAGAEFEQLIKEDMKMQMRWVNIIKPKWAMLKFRLPYQKGKVKYLGGILHFQVWPGETSTETRLWISDRDGTYETKIYDNVVYEQYMFRHNVCTRMQHFDLPFIADKDILKFEGLEFDYDSRAEIEILIGFLKMKGKEITMERLLELYQKINTVVKTPLSETHGRLPLLKPGREKFIKLMKMFPMEEKIKKRGKRMEKLRKGKK